MPDNRLTTPTHAFVVRIWAEPAAGAMGDDLLWRGRVEHAASGRYTFFQSPDELLHFIQSYVLDLRDHQSVPGRA